MKRALSIVAALVAVTVAVAVAIVRPGQHVSARTRDVATDTAPVVRTDLTTQTQEAGTLEYPPAGTVVDQRAGTAFTALPDQGASLTRGTTAFEVDGIGVPVFYGARPMWRDLQVGVTPDADVAELNANLVALGYLHGLPFASLSRFTSETRVAVDAWQRARNVTVTGAVRVGDVVYVAGAIRVGAPRVSLGAPAQPGVPVFDATAAIRVVDIALPVAHEYLVHPGASVTVTLPDGHSTTEGVVYAIGTAAQPQQSQQSNSAAPQNQSEGNTIDVTVALRDPRAAGTYTNAPVVVNIVSARVRNVLAVPVEALEALAEGGYAVTVVDGTHHRLERVETGMFANDAVQVSGSDLAAGTLVEVPAS
jgi:hypothetical protein